MNTFDTDKAKSFALGSVYAVLNRQDLLAELVQHDSSSLEEWYEVLLQTYLFAGFPCALEALTTLKNCRKQGQDHIFEYDTERFLNEGEKTCRLVYGSVYERLQQVLQTVSPELTASMIIEGYGKILSRPQLDIRYRECCIVVMLMQLGWENQFISHKRGALRVGVEVETLNLVVDSVFELTSSQGLTEPIVNPNTLFP